MENIAAAPEFFTICARNYLALATALGQSLRAVYPQATLTVWLLDYDDQATWPEVLRVRPIEEAVPEQTLLAMKMRYSILEFSTAVKPAAFIKTFAEGANNAIYFDPDIFVYSSIDEIFTMLEQGASGVVIPHILTPLPKDNVIPDDLSILKSGVFNLGFLALSDCNETHRFLHWWNEWLKTDCWADPSTGVFTDQRWMDFVPCLWPGIRVCYHEGYDVAYWNLHERGEILKKDDQWFVNLSPLRFFHFSGFDPDLPHKVSKHEHRLNTIAKDTSLYHLFKDYAAVVLAARNDYWRKLPLPKMYFDNGCAVDSVARQCFHFATSKGLHFEKPLQVGPGNFFEWLCSREIGSNHSRYVLALLEMRQDVKNHYSDFEGAQKSELENWIATDGVQQMDLDRKILLHLKIIHPSYALTKPSEDQDLMVNYIGYLRAAMGVGEAARGYVRALHYSKVKTTLLDISHLTTYAFSDDSLTESLSTQIQPEPHVVNLLHINADTLPMTISHLGPNNFQGHYNVGIWAWESEEFPTIWHDRYAHVDEIWVGSHFMAEGISRHAPCPVIVMPYAVNPPAVAADRARFGLPEEDVLYLFSFDFHSYSDRKNPDAVIEAFRKSFSPQDKATLVIKAISVDSHPEAMMRIRELVGDAKIKIIPDNLSRLDQLALIASCDVYVSLHRLEGFGLGMAEAMAFGKAVIATAYGGNTDFMRSGNSILVPYRLVQLERNVGPYSSGSYWADPDIDFAARAMRELYVHPEQRAILGKKAKADIAAHCGYEAVGKKLRDRLMVIRSIGKPAATANVIASQASSRKQSRNSPSNSILRICEVGFLLMKDIVREPSHYIRNAGRAYAYRQRLGNRATWQRLVHELRRRY